MIKKLVILVSLISVAGCMTVGKRRYEPAWESLQRHPDPKWYGDAKFGLYWHWGIYSVPAFENEWYPRLMYIDYPEKEEEKNDRYKTYEHHRETYGPQEAFGYKDFIPMFKAEKFNPDEWAELFRKSGAKFAGPVAEHADGFAMWASKLTKWDAADMGPKRDIVGELEKAIRKQGLKFITTFHHQWLWAWYPTWSKNYDTGDPKYSGLYGPYVPDESAFKDPQPNEEFCRRWMEKVKEVIDKYRPDLLYFDSRLGKIGEKYRQELFSYYYNKAEKWGKEVGVTYKGTDLPVGAGILDLERGRMSGLRDFKWQNDDSIDWDTWCHIENPDYKSANRLIEELIDIVSKNGNLLLNITPKANGEIPEPVKERLLEIGAWLEVNGEAIYGTRPWKVYGEGPTEVAEGMFSERKIPDFTAEDIRFTTKGNNLYAICMDWPVEELKINSINTVSLRPEKISSIKMLGGDKDLKWQLAEDSLTIKVPDSKPCAHAFVFRIELK